MFHSVFSSLSAAAAQASPGAYAAELRAGMLIALCFVFVGILKCIQLMLRKATSALCLFPLLVFFIATESALVAQLMNDKLTAAAAFWEMAVFCVLLLVGMLLGIVGLALFSRGRFEQGRKQAWCGIVLGMAALSLRVFITYEMFVNDPNGGVLAYMNWKPGGAAVELVEANCRLSPSTRWVRIDEGEPSAALVMKRERPNLTATLISEKGVIDGKTIIARAKAELKEAEFENEKTQLVRGLSWETMEASWDGEGFSTIWALSSAGRGYRLIVTGSGAGRSAVSEAARALAESFAIIDPSRANDGATPLKDATFAEAGFRTKLAPLGWQGWKPDGIEGAALLASHPSMTFFAADVIPLWADLENLDDIENGFFAHFDALNLLKSSAKREAITLMGADEARRFTIESPDAGNPLFFRGITARAGRRAYFFLAWRTTKDWQFIDPALEAIELPPEDSPLPAPRDQKAAQRQSQLLNRVGDSFAGRADWRNAEGAYRLSWQLFDGEIAVLSNLVRALVGKGALREAHARLKSREADLVNHPKLQSEYAMLKKKIGDSDGAIEQLKKVFENGSRDESEVLEYLKLLIAARRPNDAVRFIDRFVDSGPVSAGVLRLRAECYEAAGSARRAMDLYEDLSAKFPFDPMTAYGLGELANKSDDHDRAAKVAADLLKAGNDNARTRMIEGWSLFGKKEWRQAKAAFEKARIFSPDDPKVSAALEQVAELLGESESSVKTPIAPVEIPKELEQAIAKIGAETTMPGGAPVCFLQRVVAFDFQQGKSLRTTTRRSARILNYVGNTESELFSFSFDPRRERIHVNRLVVTDPNGDVLAKGAADAQLIVDTLGESSAFTYRKALRIVVAGMKPGCTVDITVTREDRGPSYEFPFVSHICALPFPSLAEAIVLTGDVAKVRAVASPEMQKAAVVTAESGVSTWLVKQPVVLRPEADLPFATTYLPVLRLGPEGGSWAAKGRDYLNEIAPLLRPDALATRLAQDIAAKLKNDDEKIQALTSYVQNNVTYQALDFGRNGRIPKPAAEVIERRFGDCKDQSLLLYQMLQSVGVPAELALVKSDGDIEPSVPAMDQFNHMIVRLPGQKAAFVDPTTPCLPGGKLPPDLLNRQALVLYREGAKLESIPARSLFPAETLKSDRDVTVGADGKMTVKETVQIEGYFAMDWRNWAKRVPAASQISTMQRLLEKSRWSLKELSFEGVEDNFATLVIKLEYTVSAGSAAGALTIPALWEMKQIEVPFTKERRFPFEILHTHSFQSSAKIHFLKPPDASALKDFGRSADSEFGKWKLEAKPDESDPNTAVFQFEFQAPNGSFPASRFAEWQTFRSKIAEAWRQPLTIK